MIEFSEEHRDIREMVADFSDNELAQRAEAVDAAGEFPSEILAQIGELGLLGASLPDDVGGGGGDTRMGVLIWEELARGCGTTATLILNHSLVAGALVHGATDAGRAHVPPLAAGGVVATFLCAEPESASAEHVTTTASANGDGFVLSGTKSNVLAVRPSRLYAVVAVDDRAQRGLYLVDGGAEAPGVEITRDDVTMGLRGAGVGEVVFDSAAAVRVGDAATVDRTLAIGRLGVASVLVGLSRASAAHALQYASQRTAFGRTIDRFEALQLKFAHAESSVEAARLLVYRAAQLVDSGQPFAKESYQARIMAGQAAYQTTKESIQVLGGNGYSREYPVERTYRDVNTLSIMEGADDWHRLALARELIGMRS